MGTLGKFQPLSIPKLYQCSFTNKNIPSTHLKMSAKAGVTAHASNPSTVEAEADRSL